MKIEICQRLMDRTSDGKPRYHAQIENEPGYLSGIKISKKELQILTNQRTIVCEGDLIVYKKLSNNIIAKLLIPKEAKRLGGMAGRKCRAEYAIVLDGEGYSLKDNSFKYKVGEKVIPDSFDPNPLVECSNGIHFFPTRQEAEEFE